MYLEIIFQNIKEKDFTSDRLLDFYFCKMIKVRVKWVVPKSDK